MKSAVRGVLGTLLIIAVVISTLTYRNWPLLRNTDTVQVEFAEAGGLKKSDEVVVSGCQRRQGRPTSARRRRVVVTVKLSDHDLHLGGDTRADIITVTLLGRAAVRLEPRGRGDLERGATIPVARTGSPYDVTQALSELTGETQQIDTDQVAAALRQVSTTFADTPQTLGPALTGIRKVSATLASNDKALQDLLANAKRRHRRPRLAGPADRAPADLRQRLLSELDARQQVITGLLASARSLSHQLTAVAKENGAVLPATLAEVNQVVDLLNRNKRNLQLTITGLRNYATAFGEAISSGPFFDAYIQNLTSPGTLAPVISGLTP
jgi:phospholipid/cholesterol/gamma-HCH transport system substrate-binding protein